MPFVAVGAAGFVVQLASLHALVSYAGVHYLVATALAVEAAILHNFVWHSRWTWRDRPPQAGVDARLWRLVRFNGLSALSSVVGNVAFTAVLVDTLGVPIVAANAIAVALVSAVNFAGPGPVGVCRRDRRADPPRVPTAAVLAVLSLSVPFDASAAELTAATRRAWQRYVAATEARIERELHTPGRFLSLDFDAPADRQRARAALRDGTVMVTNLQGESGAGVDAAVRHHPSLARRRVHSRRDRGRSAARRGRSHRRARPPAGGRGRRARALAVAECAAAVLEIATPGDCQRRPTTPSTMSCIARMDSGRASSRSVATRIAEVVNLGEPGEYERPAGRRSRFSLGSELVLAL